MKMLGKKRKGMGGVLAGLLAFSTGVYVVEASAQEAFDAEAYFKKALAERGEGRPYSAIEAFQTILSNDPSLHRARLELALTYSQTLELERALALAQEVLDDPETPANVRVTVLAFQAQLREDLEKMQPKHKATPWVSIGYMYDSNVNVGPSSNIININGTLRQLPTDSVEIEDDAITLQAGLDHRYQTGTVVRVGEKATMLYWVSSASAYRRAYDSEDDFNLDVITLSTGPGLIHKSGWRTGVPLTWDYIRLGEQTLANFVTLAPTLTLVPRPRTEVSLNLALSERNYIRTQDEGRDNTYYSLGGDVGHVYLNGTLAVKGGVDFIYSDAEDEQYTYDGWDFFIGGNWEFLPKTSAYGKVNYRTYDYDGIEPTALVARDEDEQRYLVGVSHTYENLLALKLEYLRTDVDSNVDFYTFDRDQLMLTATMMYE